MGIYYDFKNIYGICISTYNYKLDKKYFKNNEEFIKNMDEIMNNINKSNNNTWTNYDICLYLEYSDTYDIDNNDLNIYKIWYKIEYNYLLHLFTSII